MTRSRSGPGWLLLVTAVVAVIGTACGDVDAVPGTNGLATTGTTVAPATTVPQSDQLECESDARTMGHGDPAPEFDGHATPEDAVMAIASTIDVSGTPQRLEGDTWLVLSDAGLAVARTEVEPWQSGWIATEILACEISHGG